MDSEEVKTRRKDLAIGKKKNRPVTLRSLYKILEQHHLHPTYAFYRCVMKTKQKKKQEGDGRYY